MTHFENVALPFRLLKEHEYALIDRCLMGDSQQDIAEIAPDLLPIVPMGMEGDIESLPALLDLSTLSNDAHQALFSLLESKHHAQEILPIVCLFKCDASIEQLHRHWVQKIIVQTTLGKKFLLRSYAPSVFVQLQRIYSPAQIRALFGNIKVWSIYHDQCWHSITAPTVEASNHRLIEETQLAQLLRIQAINRTLAELTAQPNNLQADGTTETNSQRPHYRADDPADYFAMSRTVDSLIAHAQAYGLTSEDDQVLFALHGCSLSPQFDAHPRIQQLLAERDPQEQTYHDVVALLQPEDWQRIRFDLQSPAFPKA